MIKSYRDLHIWQKSFKLSLLIYKLTKKFPPDEVYGLSSQMRRGAVSIPSNIAEGYARGQRKEYLRFIRIFFGSGAELETQLLLAKELNYISEDNYQEVKSLLEEVMKMLNVLISKLQARTN